MIDIEKIGKAEIAVEIKSVGCLSDIDFTQKTAGKGVNIHTVRNALLGITSHKLSGWACWMQFDSQ